jgi:hypothetical protein
MEISEGVCARRADSGLGSPAVCRGVDSAFCTFSRFKLKWKLDTSDKSNLRKVATSGLEGRECLSKIDTNLTISPLNSSFVELEY